MKIKSISLNQKLAAVAIAFGFIALIAGNPYTGNTVTLDTKELALIVEKELDHVKAEDLADWIIQNCSDYRLLDLRSEKDYSEYHIPTAEWSQLSQLGQYPIYRNEKIILYSEGGIHSSQAWMLLRARGFKSVYMLMGGLDEWKEKILFPKIPDNPTKEQLTAYNKIKSVSMHFGGSPQTGGSEEKKVTIKALPKMELKKPAQTGKTGRKKKEGC